MNTRLRVWNYCRACAELHNGHAPSRAYADAVARMLFGTAMKESRCIHRRQRANDPDIFPPAASGRPNWDYGAFGLFQCEWRSSIMPTLRWLRKRTILVGNVQRLLDTQYSRTLALSPASKSKILVLLENEEGDLLSCILARLHYSQKPEPIPAELDAQAHYWIRLYNGFGSCKKWMKKGYSREDAIRIETTDYSNRFTAHCLPVIQEAA